MCHASSLALGLTFSKLLSLRLVVEIQSLRMGLVPSPLQLFPLSAYFLLAYRVWANY